MRRFLLVLSALLALLVAACGGVEGSSPRSTDAVEPGDTDTTTTTSESISSTTSTVGHEETVVEALAEGWLFEPIDLPVPAEADPAVDEYDSVKRLVAGPAGMLAFGDFFVPDQPQSLLVVWHSEDGRVWQEVGREQFANAEIRDIAAGDNGFVAVGNLCTVDDPAICMADPAVWTSPNGRDWTRVPHDPELFPGCTDQGGHEVNEYLQDMLDGCANGTRPSLEKLSATSEGFLAVGMDPTWTMLWHSEDGLTWNRVDSSARPQSERVGDSGWWVNTDHVGAQTKVGLLQPGQRCMDIVEGEEFRSECHGFIWSSADGQEWAAIDIDDETITEWTPVSIVTGDAGVVVFGFESDPCTWCPPDIVPEISIVGLTSVDGIAWTSFTLKPPVPGTVWEHNALVTPLGYIAMAEQLHEPQLAGMWHSIDALEWTLIPEMSETPKELWPNSIAWDGDTLIMFGSAMQDGERILVLGRWSSS